MVVDALLGEQLADRSVAQANLEQPLTGVPRQVAAQIRVHVHVGAIEARETFGRGVLDTDRAGETGAAKLRPELGVGFVQLLLWVFDTHARIIPHGAARTVVASTAPPPSR